MPDGVKAVALSQSAEGDDGLAANGTKLTELQQEEQKLQEQLVKSASAFSRASKPEIDSKSKGIDELAKQLEAGQSKGFWRDICDDGDGVSFHRRQVVIWTIGLGRRLHSDRCTRDVYAGIFVLDISNATYLGLRIPGQL